MLRRILDLPAGVLGISAIGEVTEQDYEEVIGRVPSLDDRRLPRTRLTSHERPEPPTWHGDCRLSTLAPRRKERSCANFYPGIRSLSLATLGCNFQCEFCQN